MKVSIIIPVYNVAQYIKRCLYSVSMQTYKHIECIIVDDCGTDNSMSIIEDFITNLKRNIEFRIIRHLYNKGISESRNTGIHAATGEYIYFLDSDDAISFDCIETLVNIAQKFQDADFIAGNTIKGSGMLMESNYVITSTQYYSDKKELEYFILQKQNRTAWNKLIKLSFILNKSILFPSNIIMEDHYWTWLLAKHTNAAVFTNIGTYFYYRTEKGITQSKSIDMFRKRSFSYIEIAKRITNDFKYLDNIQNYHRIYLGETIIFALENLVKSFSISNWRSFWSFISKMAWEHRTRITWYRTVFYLCMMPPLCFFAIFKAWRWRLRHYITDNL